MAAACGLYGKKTLLIDADPQGNATSGLGISKKDISLSVYDVLIGKAKAEAAIIATEFKNLSVLPSNIGLAGAEFELADFENREFRLKNALAELRDSYDCIAIDCPPSLGLLTINALSAADGIVIPMICEYYALEGLSQLMISIKQVKKLYNPALEITGILITMHNGRLNLSVQVIDELKKYYPDKLFKNMIQRNIRLTEAPGYGKPGIYYDKFSRGSLAYKEAAKEMIKRIGI